MDKTNNDWQTILGNAPSKSNCYKIITKKIGSKIHASLAKSDALITYENKFFIQCNLYRNKPPITGYFELYVKVYYPSERSDLDNSLKIILDCLQKKCNAIKNDNKCVRIIADKFLDKKNPRIEFKVIQK